MDRQGAGTIWIDVTELFDWFLVANHPTGVSRVVLNLWEQLALAPGERFRAARPLVWLPGANRPMTFDCAQLGSPTAFLPRLAALYDADGLAHSPHASRWVKAFATSLPRALRYRLFPADNGATLFARWARQRAVELAPVTFARGDSLFFPGSFWLGRYRRRLTVLARASEVPITAFVHDLLLLTHPEWLPGGNAPRFREACEDLLPRCEALACNSEQTALELRRLIRVRDDVPVQVCRFADLPTEAESVEAPAEVAEMIGRRYVMFVSTMIPRKNHRLLVEAWRRLWSRLGASTPYLLFVGGGQPDDDLAELMRREQAEGGRVVRLRGVDDAALELLYRHAWMTAYPSLGEGYGMPVAEALSRGKVCLAGEVAGVREAGAGLIDVIDIADPLGLADLVADYVASPARLAAREGEIRAGYRPTGWSQTAQSVRAVLESTIASD